MDVDAETHPVEMGDEESETTTETAQTAATRKRGKGSTSGGKSKSKVDGLLEGLRVEVLNALEQGHEYPWTGKAMWDNGPVGLPVNFKSERRYSGSNVFSLLLHGRAYPESLWGGYRQWADAGYHVRKGETGTQILMAVAVRCCKDENCDGDGSLCNGSKRLHSMVRHVFNVAQVEPDTPDAELPSHPYKNKERMMAGQELRSAEEVHQMFAGAGADIRPGGDKAQYLLDEDTIQMPPIDSFSSPEAYASVLAHEHIHWSGAEHRLNREKRDAKSWTAEEDYAREEMVAEMGAAVLCSMLGLESRAREDHAKYVSEYMRVLDGPDGAKALRRAMTEAVKAAEYVASRIEDSESAV